VKPDDYTVETIDFAHVDSIRLLWEDLNASHAALSTHFGGHFKGMTFEKRKAEFREKAAQGDLRIDVCVHSATMENVGYCVSNKIREKGEIDSLFTKKAHRGKGVGSRLVEAAIKWMRDSGASEITVHVAIGNEPVINFYRQFGLLPRLILLSSPANPD
jgi:ribosomal protein S18 acetylase RimI-like enzyme